MSLIEVVGLTTFILVLFLGLFTSLFGFPGTILILISVVAYSFITGFQAIGIKIILSLILISAVAETIEFMLGMAGAKKPGPSGKAILGVVVGGTIGAVLMTPVLLGLGTLIGALLGSLIGLFTVDIIRERRLKPSARATTKAIAGGITGSLAKGIFALVMIVIVLSAIYS